MTGVQKKVREYLAEIGKRGGLASRRELSRSHAKQMARDPRSETRGVKNGQAVATAQPQVARTLLRLLPLSIVSRL